MSSGPPAIRAAYGWSATATASANYFIEHGNDHREYFVVFDRAGVVTQSGFDSCMNADRKGTLQPGKAASR